MSKRKVGSQITNYKTYLMYRRQMISLAENVFEIINLPKNIYLPYVYKNLLLQGSIAFFYDDVLNEIEALPYVSMGTRDLYGRPTIIRVYGQNGYSRVLNEDEFVIMYDNNAMYSLYLDILQYAERMAEATRVIDVNLGQMRTPRFIKTTPEHEASVKRIFEDVDECVDKILTYNDIELDDTTICLQPAPYVADKVQEEKDKIWAEFLRLIGVSNLSTQKKERNITDEIQAMQGGTIASRYSRFEPRLKAVEEINIKFGKYLEKPLEVRYYDGEPSNSEKDEEVEIDYYDDLNGGDSND